MSIVHVEVTEEDIEGGKLSDPRECPVALALARTTAATHVSVGCWNVRLIRDETAVQCDLPLRVSNFIDAYDMGRDVDPFSFDLDIPADPTEKP